MPDYSKAIVYKLCCKDIQITDIYIGSTCNFSRRKCAHKHDCNNEKYQTFNLKVYQFIRQNGGFENWDMIQIEAYPECTTKRELEQYERFHIEQLRPLLNCNIPTRTVQERCIINKEIIAEKQKGYYKQNKKNLIEYQKEYREQNKEILVEKSKKYREQNKEIISKKNKEYREQNKEIIVEKNKKYYEKNKEKFVCECGSEIIKSYLARHKKTKRHLLSMNLPFNPSPKISEVSMY